MSHPQRFVFRAGRIFLAVVHALFLFGGVEAQGLGSRQPGPALGGEYKSPRNFCLSETKRAAIKAEVDQNVERLRAEGKLPIESPLVVPPSLIFPVQAHGGGLSDYGVHYDAGGIDHDPLFPNMLKDYNCGTRTYDWANGYNHTGTDIASWPFGWNKMDRDEAAVVAAAAGTLVFRDDGHPDRSCGVANINDVNVITIKHYDGSFTLYGHMKKNSLTGKLVGSHISQGEYLGIVGSSGGSYAPHLHFEVATPAGQIQDPYQGPCNVMNANSYWQNQPPYYDSKINKLMTHSEPPVFPACPNPEIENSKSVFQPGEPFIMAAYYRSQVAGQVSQLSLIKPNGDTYTSWSHPSPNTYLVSYWYWAYPQLPMDMVSGVWKFRVVYPSPTYEHLFTVSGHKAQFDFDGDRRTDISIFRPAAGEWWYQESSDSEIRTSTFGSIMDKLTPADFTGDGKADLSVWRPASGEWFVIRSEDATFYSFPFGTSGDTPVPGDFDADNIVDAAVFRPSNGHWYIHRSSDSGITIEHFGQAGDVPGPADYDGDGETDVAVYRPSAGEWWILRSSAGTVAIPFGESTDKLVPADYTGDGKADVAFWRPSTGEWFILRSEDLSYYSIPFGTPGDTPVPGDYDGDGRSDPGIFRPSNSTWYIDRSTAGVLIQTFGRSGDVPVPSVFVP